MTTRTCKTGRWVSIALVAGSLLVSACSKKDAPAPRAVLGPWAGSLKTGPNMNAENLNLRGSEFVGQNLAAARFDGCCLFGVLFHNCDLSSASFIGADLTAARFEGCDIRGADFKRATINGMKGDFRLSPSQLRATKSYVMGDLRNCSGIAASGH